MTNSDYRVTSAILCEGIRQEVNNKYCIFGVYSGDIHVASFPVKFPISAFIELKGLALGSHALTFRFRGPGSEVVGEGELVVTGPTAFALPLPTVLLDLNGPGQLNVDLKIGDSAWQTIITKQVSLGKFDGNGHITRD